MKRNVLSRLMLMLLCLLITGAVSSCDPISGGGKRDCVVVIGDSIFRLYNNIVPSLQNRLGFTVRRYDVTGSEMQGGMQPGSNIVNQLKKALNQGPVRTLIMDGGGNDFIISGALAPAAARREVKAAYEKLFQMAAEGGVENVLVMGYYKTSTTTAITNASEQDVEDLTLGLARSLGMNAAHFDPSDQPWFSNKLPAQYINPTDAFRVHPSNAAGQKLAEFIYDMMTKNFSGVIPSDQNYEPMEQGGGC